MDGDVFADQVALLRDHRVVSLDQALDELEAGDDSPKVVVTFDDGFRSVHEVAFPLLSEAELPFTIFLATSFMGAPMRWEGAAGEGTGVGLTWDQLRELADSELVTIGNHTHRHVRPERLSEEELEACSAAIEGQLGVTPRHFAYPWGVRVPSAEPWLRERFRSAATGEVGRNHPGDDPLRLRRVPVRASDPLPFFEAKLTGRLLPERIYGRLVAVAKTMGGSG